MDFVRAVSKTQLAHGTSFDLADALTSEIEVLANLFEGPWLTEVEAEAQLEDFPLAFVERGE